MRARGAALAGIALLLPAGLFSQQTLPVPVCPVPLAAQVASAGGLIAGLAAPASFFPVERPFQAAVSVPLARNPAASARIPSSRKAAPAAAALGVISEAAAEAGRGVRLEEAAAKVFDNGKTPVPAVPAGAPRPISMPRGVRSAALEYARTPADVQRLIPFSRNSASLIALLKHKIGRIGPVGIVTYTDGIGRQFAGIDLRERPALLDDIPELQDHEVVLIRKILKRTRDVQVLVREEGKTPDLVVDGVVTEIKSSFEGKKGRLLSKADDQVYAFNSRHLLSGGDAAIDLVGEDRVPVEKTLQSLKDWSSQRKRVVLDRIWVHAGSDLKTFHRGPDGSFHLEAPDRPKPALDPSSIQTLQMLAMQGRLGDAQRILFDVEKAGRPEKHSPAWQAREWIETRRMLLRLRKLAYDQGQAAAIWENFRRTHDPETVRAAEREAREALGPAPASEPTAVSGPEEPRRVMREAGIKESVAVFGGARVVSPERAREALDRALAEAGTGSWTAEAGKKVTSASQDLARSKWFSMARDFGARVAQDGAGEIAVAVDGGPGIAEAVGLGAAENGGPTAAFILRAEKAGQATPGLSFEFRDAALRGRAMRHEASALVYFPGGFTTTNALSDTFALMRKGKAPRVPIILVGPRAYWENLFDLRSLRRLGLVSDEDLKLLVFAEDAQEAWAAVRAARRPKPGSL